VVHYDDQPERALSAACALSAIVHPAHPHAPSMHLHVSWTARKDGGAYWRVMADLNPAIPDPAQARAFRDALTQAAGPLWDDGAAQGDRYFAIPALDRTRGVVHFYLEGFDSGDFEADRGRAQAIEAAAIDTYGDLVEQAGAAHPAVTDDDRAAQLAYHTAYLFQVLTLDRGTTSGLMVHGDNDVGILGSLPAQVDRRLLASWADRVDPRQRALVEGLVAALPDAHPSPVTIASKQRLADAVRAFYQADPGALDLQARGDVLPPTVANHQQERPQTAPTP
jgi:coproporphyrinogen III oxidase